MSQNKNPSKDNTAIQQPNVLPATEIAQNQNPRANENLLEKDSVSVAKDTGSFDNVGSEITDGEDA